jgi:hypothetical protein
MPWEFKQNGYIGYNMLYIVLYNYVYYIFIIIYIYSQWGYDHPLLWKNKTNLTMVLEIESIGIILGSQEYCTVV